MNYEKVNGMSSEALEKATGKGWKDWIVILKKQGFEQTPHKEIADWLHKTYKADGWWCQTITVGFEKSIGRRTDGERSDGSYEVSVGKTLSGSMDDVLKLWKESVKDKTDFNGLKVSDEPSISKTEKWRYWRASLDGGIKVNVNIYEKNTDKSALSLQMLGLKSSQELEDWKVYWKEFFTTLIK